MIYSVNFMDLAEKINPSVFVKYLKDTGWKLFPMEKTYIKVFQIYKENGEAFQVIIPLDNHLSDYKNAMYEAIETVAYVENQPTEQLLLFLLNPNTDILKIRLEKEEIEAGNILFDDAIRLYENIKKLVVATAQDILHPQRYHQGRIDSSISQFISKCKFGQTEVGSYVISIVCPFTELDDVDGCRQLSIFSEEEQCADSLTRKVTNKIMTNVAHIKGYIDEGDFDKLHSEESNEIISANFYEALAGLNLDAEGSSVEFTVHWSPAVKLNRCATDRILLSHNYYQPITAAIQKAKEQSGSKSKIFGKIKRLESTPDLSNRISGKITVVYLDGNDRKRTVEVQLAKEDYDKAIEAHSHGDYIEIVGDIQQTGQRNVIASCDYFGII